MDHNENSKVEKILSTPTPQKPQRTDTDLNMKEWISELRLHMKSHQSKKTVVDGHGVSMMESLQLPGIFNDMRIVKFPDYSSQLLLHVASKTFAAFDPDLTRYKDQEGTCQVSSSNSKPASILLPSKTAVRQASRPSMGAPCSCSTNINNISGPHSRAQCECALGDPYHKLVTDALKLTKTFLTALESTGMRQRSAQVEIMSVALEKWMGLAHTALVVIDGVRDEGSGGWQDDSSIPALCQHVTTLVITQVTALQMAWHSLRRKTTKTSDNARKRRENGTTQWDDTTAPQPRYVVTDKKLYTCEPPHVKVSERFAAYGLDAKFARYPILYVAWIWWSVVHSEENGDSAHGRFLAGLSESLGMCDWFTGSGRVEKDGVNVEAWLSVVVTAAATCFMRRLGSGDYAGAVRGLAGSAYLETKTKIEESFKMEPEAMTHAMEMMMMLKNNGGGDPRPPFNTWMLASMYDSGSCGMTCEDSVNSWLRGAEVPSTYNMWNDILDYSRDLACGETRSFVSLLLDGLDQSQGAESGDLVIAALFGAMEYIMKNEGIYGSASASSMPMVYSWHLATCRYGVIKLYMVNLPTYVTDSEAHEPIRLQQRHLRRLSELYDGTNLTPKISYEETTPIKHLSYQSLLETCAVYLNLPSHHLAELLNSTADVPPQKEIYEDLIDRCERELRVAGVTHERCLNICCRHLQRLIDLDLRRQAEGRIAGAKNVAVTLLALKGAHAYLKAQGLSLLWDLCKSTHFQWSIMCEVFGEAALAKEAVCASCAELYGDTVEENACVLAAEMEESICDMGFEQRIKAIRAIFGGAFFGSSYLRIPLLDLYWQMNTTIVAQGHAGMGNAGDKFTI